MRRPACKPIILTCPLCGPMETYRPGRGVDCNMEIAGHFLAGGDPVLERRPSMTLRRRFPPRGSDWRCEWPHPANDTLTEGRVSRRRFSP
jgi:hypothetical protein